ncbi:MAG: glycosyltransferase family 4 protein [Bacteriovoracia bacterium]
MKRLKIFTWHVHGSYLYYLSQIPHDIYLPKKETPSVGYFGITPSYNWPSNVYEVPVEEIQKQKYDCILFQSHQNYLKDQFEVLSKGQRELPKIYLEHDPPREHPTDTTHPVNDPDVMVVHVTDFNRLMWDCGRSPTLVIDHGVMCPDGVEYKGDLERGLVVVNNIQKRGRRLGLDIFKEAQNQLTLDLIGMGWEEVGGLGEVPHSELPSFSSQYRFFYNPIRYTSLGLSICEAMMVGLPVIGLATTELATLIKNDVNGFISNRPSELIEASKELLKDKRLAQKWSAGARKTANERFSIKRFVHDWDECLKFVTAQ